MERYRKNRSFISSEEQSQLAKKRVFVAGCGGLGGYIIEQLARIGIGHLSLLDDDVFEISNLNRQLYATESNIGQSKVEAAIERISLVNSGVSTRGFKVYLNKTNARELIAGHHLVMDALDNIESRLVLAQACRRENIPLIHGAIGGLAGQFGLILPGEGLLERIYSNHTAGIELTQGNPAFTPGLVATYQVAMAVQFLLGRDLASNTLHYLDVTTFEIEKITF